MKKLSEQQIIRREKKKKIEDLGINPYPSSFETNSTAKNILDNFNDNHPEFYLDIAIAGRIMAIRLMGASAFVEIRNAETNIQVYIHRDSICKGEDKTLYDTFFKKLIDIGDIVGIQGYVFRTKVGEISIHANSIKILSKSLKPLPAAKEVEENGEKKVHDAFTNPEARYRERYVDLILNREVRDIFIKRGKIINSFREILQDRGYLEVETPILQPIHGGAAAKPFKTHHNTLDMELFLRIAPELYLKKLIAGGFNGVYEIAKNFRNEGMSRFHNPEFSMLELYVAYKDYKWMMNFTEEIIEEIVKKINFGKSIINYDGNEVNFSRPWKRYTLAEVIKKYANIDILSLSEKQLKEEAIKMEIKGEDSFGKAKLIDEIFGKKCEPHLINPTFITDYPIEMSPLAKKKNDNQNFVERFEVICNGKEICNAYSELNDPIDQRIRFEEQINLANKGDEEAMMLDEDFLNALEYGMPPTAGLGIGLDRLIMILTNSQSIQEVIFFPQMRHKNS